MKSFYGGINKLYHAVSWEERAGCFAFIVLRISCYCKCSVAFPHDVVGWPGAYDFCISDHTH